MKLALVWAVAAYVVAAELPCDEYCVCASTGIRNVAHQPECDCMKGDSRVMAQLDDSGIYYEPAEYFPAPTFFYGQPFFILNPYVALRRKQVPQASKPRTTPHNTNPDDQMMNSDSTLNSHRRKEKDTDSVALNSKKASIYLDIDMPKDSERSASNILNPEDFQSTERNLLECIDLYTVLDYRKHGNPDLINAKSIIAKYEHQSDADLISKIDSKCSQIADIVQRSLKEIKETRPKKIHATFRMLDQEHMSHLQRDNERLSTTQIVDTKKVALESPHNVNRNLGKADKDATIEEKTVVIYTDSASEENMEDNQNSLHTDASVTDDQQPPMKTERTTSSQTDSMHTATETATIYTETNPLPTLPTTAVSSTYHMGSTNIVDQHFLESRQSNDQHTDSDTERNESRPGYKDKAPLLKVFTQEFANNTVKSFVNGTENTFNRDFDFDNDSKPTEEAATSFNGSIIETSLKDEMKDKSPDVTGNLLFLYNKHHIPAKFVQAPNGTLHVGIDGGSLCEKVQDGEHKSALLTTLCKCYKTGDCLTK